METAFDALKMRWRRLDAKFALDLKILPDVVMVSCILHNLCILKHDPLPDDDLDVYLTRERQFAESDVAEDLEDIEHVRNQQTSVFKDVEMAAKGDLLDFGTNVPKDLRDAVATWILKNT